MDKISHSKDLLSPSSPQGLPTSNFVFDHYKGSWLPWGRVPMPLISPLMPVTHYNVSHISSITENITILYLHGYLKEHILCIKEMH